MAKKNQSTYIYLGIGAALLFLLSTFKKKGQTETGNLNNYFIAQKDAPSGTYQVYSKINTKIYDRDGNLIYTFKDPNLGMTVTDTNQNGTLSIVFGVSFDTGLPGFVLPNEVQYV
jgi:hypothetical protein